jgi:hypothetical protein
LALLKTFRWTPLRPIRLYYFLYGLWRDVVPVFLPDFLYRRWHKYRGPNYNFIRPDFAARMQALVEPGPVQRPQVRGRWRTQANLFDDGHLAERMERWAAGGAAHRLVYSYPLLDRRLVEFAFRLPDHMYLQHGVDRYLYRQAMAPFFPGDMTRRRIKSEPGMKRHNQLLIQFMAQKQQMADVRALQDMDDVPWVDVARLRQVMQQQPVGELSIDDQLAVARAMQCLVFWNELQTSKRHNTSRLNSN